MIYLGNIPKRYFDVVMPDGTALNIAAPSLRAVKQLEDITRNPMNYTLVDTEKVIAELLSNNRQNKNITEKDIEEQFDYDMPGVFIKSYMDWVKTGRQDPN